MNLRSYLSRNAIAPPAFAKLIGVGEQAVYRYMSGRRIPRPAVMQRIIKETGGKVRPGDFYREAA